MLNHPTLDRLRELGLDGMAKGFRDLAANPESRALEHGEWLGLLVDQEFTLRGRNASRREPAPPSCDNPRLSRRSISAFREALTEHCS